MSDEFNWRIGEDLSTKRSGGVSDPRVVIKDILDLEGCVTTVGSRLIASRNVMATSDAASLEMMVDRGVTIVGKSNLVELAFGTQGINPWFGTPSNPIDPTLIPGGSSSGSAVAAAIGACDFAIGTDTGGSIRIPAACCGIYGLKTTWGRISTKGCYPLAPSLDSVGPLAASIDLLESAFSYLAGEVVDVSLDESQIKLCVLGDFLTPVSAIMLTAVLDSAGVKYEIVQGGDRSSVHRSASDLLAAEALSINEGLLKEAHRLDPAVRRRLIDVLDHESSISDALEVRHHFSHFLDSIFDEFNFIVVPTLNDRVPTIKRAYDKPLNLNTLPFNFAMLPAISVPVSREVDDKIWSEINRATDDNEINFEQLGGRERWETPFSMQIVAPLGKEEALIAYAKALASHDILK
ncbi:MAG: amidase [Actinomycetota bacterium]|nr:amidase [Actinomycetota bacterium]